MALSDVLTILQTVERIITALNGMGVKVNGAIDIGDILKLIPKNN